MSNALLHLGLGWQKKCKPELGEEERRKQRRAASQGRTKAVGASRRALNILPWGSLCKELQLPQTGNQSHQSQVQYDLSQQSWFCLSAGLVKVQSRGAHGRPDCKYIFSL